MDRAGISSILGSGVALPGELLWKREASLRDARRRKTRQEKLRNSQWRHAVLQTEIGSISEGPVFIWCTWDTANGISVKNGEVSGTLQRGAFQRGRCPPKMWIPPLAIHLRKWNR